jgi:hypothetical protein
MYRNLMYVRIFSNCGDSIYSRISYEAIQQFLLQKTSLFLRSGQYLK